MQGMDYAYTLQGWLKGMNADSLSSANDIGRDGDVTLRPGVARDVVGYAISYYSGDFTPVGTTKFNQDLAGSKPFSLATPQLFNGNIRAIALHNKKLDDGKPIGYAYSYDQLHRIKAMDAWKAGAQLDFWKTTVATTDYQERISYDGNGNIKTYTRNEKSGVVMDNLGYVYQAGTNKLLQVTDTVAAAAFPNDIDNQAANNYVYDNSGNMASDVSSGVTVTWSPYGKINDVTKTVITNSPASKLFFGYGPTQKRMLKGVILGTDTTRTYYFRDASGNVMSIYKRHADSVFLSEQDIYGSSRIGLVRIDTLINKGLQPIQKLYEGKRNYEITNHLGNVLAVINDRRTDSIIGTVKTYNAVVISASDYFPFGMTMDSRSYTATTYRYGFNGKENDKEWGAKQDYGERIYDELTGRFFPLAISLTSKK